MEDQQSARSSDLSRNYGTNWTKTNVNTLFEWISVAAYNIRCLELGIIYYRELLRRHTIIGLVLSTLSGTLSVSKFGLETNLIVTQTLNALFVAFSFTIAVFTGYLKIYQVQERLEHYIKLKQDWIVFSTTIASELQLPIELRRDALFMIIKNKNTYLDLLKVDFEIPEKIKKHAYDTLPHPSQLNLDVSTLPRIIMDIGSQELNDLDSAGARNKDRFTTVKKAADDKVNTITLDVKI